MMSEQSQPPNGDPGHQAVSLGSVLDGIVGSLTAEQFAALAERTGHATPEPKQAAAEALSQLMKRGNIAADRATTAEVTQRMARRGWRTPDA